MPVSPMSAQPFSSRSHFLANHAESMPAAVSSCPASRTTRKHIPGILEQIRKKCILPKATLQNTAKPHTPNACANKSALRALGRASAHARPTPWSRPGPTPKRRKHETSINQSSTPLSWPNWELHSQGNPKTRQNKKTTHLVVRLAGQLGTKFFCFAHFL